jgi:RNA polymerase sigma-70 factor (ECF subfamily)
MEEVPLTEAPTEQLSFDAVAEQLSQPLLRYLERLSGNRATADDLLQETMVKIARGLPGFEGRSSVKTWAFSIATRVATDHFRRPESKARIVDFDDTPEPRDARSASIGDRTAEPQRSPPVLPSRLKGLCGTGS